MTEILKEKIDIFYSGSYRRSIDTKQKDADFFGREIHTDERLRERGKGV